MFSFRHLQRAATLKSPLRGVPSSESCRPHPSVTAPVVVPLPDAAFETGSIGLGRLLRVSNRKLIRCRPAREIGVRCQMPRTPKPPPEQRFQAGGQGRDRTADPRFFRPVLYQLSYLTVLRDSETLGSCDPSAQNLAGATGFEPATSGLTGRRELQTSPRPRACPQGNSNPRCRLERAES